MRVRIKSQEILNRMRDEGKIEFGLPGGQGDFDESLYISVKEGGAQHYFPHRSRDGEYLIVDHWHPIHPQVYEKFKEIFDVVDESDRGRSVCIHGDSDTLTCKWCKAGVPF